MSRLTRILQIDPDFQTIYSIYRPGSSILTLVPLKKAIDLLKTEDFDLIVSEPLQQATLKERPHFVKSKKFNECRVEDQNNFRTVPEKYLLKDKLLLLKEV
jgi:hypothetical protein